MGIIGFQECIFEGVQKGLLFDWIGIAVVRMGFWWAAVVVG